MEPKAVHEVYEVEDMMKRAESDSLFEKNMWYETYVMEYKNPVFKYSIRFLGFRYRWLQLSGESALGFLRQKSSAVSYELQPKDEEPGLLFTFLRVSDVRCINAFHAFLKQHRGTPEEGVIWLPEGVHVYKVIDNKRYAPHADSLDVASMAARLFVDRDPETSVIRVRPQWCVVTWPDSR